MVTDSVRDSSDGMTFKVYRGGGSALLAFDVASSLRKDLAGFAVEYVTPSGESHQVLNRLSFQRAITAGTTPAQRTWSPTDEAPLQKFHWSHFPPEIQPGTFTYRATAMLFRKGTEDKLDPGPTCQVGLDLVQDAFRHFQLGFTRGYLSSQAYADRFKNAPIVPKGKPSITYNTQPFETRYAWLGFDARRLIFEFLDQAVKDKSVRLDVFAYDLNEPDIIRRIVQMGSRLRLFLDNSASHRGSKGHHPLEQDALATLQTSTGPANVHIGHFGRFAHDKVMIQTRGGKATRVLTGSANFSVRGLYVQSNSVIVFDDGVTASWYEDAFQQAWTDPSKFRRSPSATTWFPRRASGLPPFSVSFAPHADAKLSLKPVADAIARAKSSVLFAIMEAAKGTGIALDEVRRLPQRPELYAFGTTQRVDGSLHVTASGRGAPVFIPFAYLKEQVPQPFRPEVSGGKGQVIHHKFVVVDFNDRHPVAFAGSSNLAEGGEKSNGDNLIQVTDPGVVTAYAVEAIQLLDHYRFRAVKRKATTSNPLRLKTRSEDWTKGFFEPGNPKARERKLFVR